MHVSEDLKTAFRSCPSSVVVMTTHCDQGPLGMTVSSLVSLSIDPPLICWNSAKKSARTTAFQNASSIVAHILSEDQSDLALSFAKQGLEPFQGLDFAINAQSVPILPNCAVTLHCNRGATLEGGDHVILLAEVTKVVVSDKAPLAWLNGSFCGISPIATSS